MPKHKIDVLDTIWTLLRKKGYTADVTAHADGRFQIGSRMTENSIEALTLVAMLEDRTPKLLQIK
jgi:hypothetical protein